MKTILKWTRRIALVLIALVILAVAGIYVWSQPSLGRSFDVAAHPVDVPPDAVSIAEGTRLARIRGCYDGCHGTGYEGDASFEDGGLVSNLLFARLESPDLTRVASAYNDSEMERVIRHGVRPGGKSVIAMPSTMFQSLSDEDLGKILASIRSQPVGSGAETYVRIGPMARVLFMRGVFPLAADVIDHDAVHPAATPTDAAGLGRYLAYGVCTECHGDRLEGVPAAGPFPPTPPLAVVAGYSREQFGTLMKTGVPASGSELGLMAEVARGRFSHFTEPEVDALYGHLSDPATWVPAGGSR